MAKLQNNYTTHEQSKRLLELGVPVDSADCYYRNFASSRVRLIPNIRETDDKFCIDTNILIPCWSVGRLMEIFDICFPESNTACWPPYYELDTDYITYVVRLYERGIKELDFSKLEE